MGNTGCEMKTTALPLCLEHIRIGFLGQQVVLGLWGKGLLESFLLSAEGTAVSFPLEEWSQPFYEIVLPDAFSVQDIQVESGSCSFEQQSFMESWCVLEAWDEDRAVLLQMAWHGGSFVSLDTGILHKGTVEPVYTLTKDNAQEALCLEKL
jgi:hypothetical protein